MPAMLAEQLRINEFLPYNAGKRVNRRDSFAADFFFMNFYPPKKVIVIYYKKERKH